MDPGPPTPNPLPQDKPVNPPITTPTSPPLVSSTPSPQKPLVSVVSTPPSEPPQPMAKQIPVKKDINFLSKALLVLGPLIMVGLFGVSFYNLTKAPQTAIQAPAKPTTPEPEEVARQILLNVPKNPDQVTTTCLSTGEDLVSEQPTSCPDPQFTWTGEEPREPETQITGYYVYFGTNGNDEPLTYPPSPGKFKQVIKPLSDGQFQEENTFSPTELQKGTTYYLAIAAQSDSQNPSWSVGFEVIDVEKLEAQVAKILFVYQYE